MRPNVNVERRRQGEEAEVPLPACTCGTSSGRRALHLNAVFPPLAVFKALCPARHINNTQRAFFGLVAFTAHILKMT